MLLWGWQSNVGEHAPPGEMADPGSFLHAGALANAGLNPYGGYPHGVNRNLPLSVIAFQWLARLPAEHLYAGWYVASLVIYVAAFALLWRSYPHAATPARIAWALGWGSLWSSLWDGQIYAVLTFCSVVAWILLQRRKHLAAGVLIGFVCALKPNFLVWPVLLALAGSLDAAAAAAAFVALSAIPALIYGPQIYADWLVVVERLGAVGFAPNASLTGMAERLGLDLKVGQACSALALVLSALWTWRRRPDAQRASGVALAVAILAAPLSWVDYTQLLLPAFWTRRWTWPWWAAAMLLVASMGRLWGLSSYPAWQLAIFGSYGTFAVLLVLGALVAEGETGIARVG